MSLLTPSTPYAVRLPNMGKHLYPLPINPLSTGQFAKLLCNVPSEGTRAQLYLHLPFCQSICTFCLIQKYQLTLRSPVATYVTALKKELIAYTQLPYVQNLRFNNIYFGGGTPSMLEDRYLAEIFELIQRLFTLEDPQITFEGNIQSLTTEKIRFIHRLGFNRLSAGVQTFDLDLRQRLNLIPTEDDIRRCLNTAREEGFDDFNLDLMFNLPGQTTAIWERDLLKATELYPSGLDIYETVLAQRTRLYGQVKHGELALTRDPVQLARNYTLAEEILASSGYQQKNLYVWNRRQFENRLMDSQDQIRDQELDIIGAGISSYSFINGIPFFNEAGLSTYIQRVCHQGHAAVSFYRPTPRQMMRRFMIVSLQTFVFDRARFAAAFHEDMDVTFSQEFTSFTQRGLIVPSHDGYRLTPLGRAWASTMAIEFYDTQYLQDVMRGRLEKRIAVGMTREEEYDHILFTFFHPEIILKGPIDLGLLLKYIRLLKRSDPGWLRELVRSLLERSWNYRRFPWRHYLFLGFRMLRGRIFIRRT
jgi:coproporphyrinogen III oxidase-like Fe-S oxidoreductase